MIKPLTWKAVPEDIPDALDVVDGPFSVYENAECSRCGGYQSAVVKNIRGERVSEFCSACQFEKHYESKTVVL